MTELISKWSNEDVLAAPFGPLGLIAMPGFEEMGDKVNSWLLKWHSQQEIPTVDSDLYTVPAMNRDSYLTPVSCPRFSNGEGKGLISASVRGLDLYILCDVGAYNMTYKMYGQTVPMSPDDHFQNLKRIIAAVGHKAIRVNVIMPMLYEGRQHRRSSRESLDCALGLQELINMGVANIITFDAHDPRVQNAIPQSGFESVMPSYQVFKALCRQDKTLKINRDNMMIVSPDEGALDRNIFYASVLGLDMGLFYKRRDYTRIVDGRNPIVAHEYMGDSVEGKDIFVSDDIIASGDSMIDLARRLKERKANRIFCSATFGLFTSGIEKFNKAYEEGIIDKVISTNLTYCPPELKEAPWYVQADLSKYIALIIATLNHNRSLSSLLSPQARIEALLHRYHDEQVQLGIKL